jgi:hypothetical protein
LSAALSFIESGLFQKAGSETAEIRRGGFCRPWATVGLFSSAQRKKAHGDCRGKLVSSAGSVPRVIVFTPVEDTGEKKFGKTFARTDFRLTSA